MRIVKKGITNTVDWLLYTVLSDKQKESLKNIFSEKQKEKLKKLTKFGRKHQQKLAVKQLKDHLYSLGFREQALKELTNWYEREHDDYVKRLLAWELMLWYVNQYTEDGAKQALDYVHNAKRGEKDDHQLRRIAIIQAECLLVLQDADAAQTILQQQLELAAHPDLHLAMANIETTIKERLHWINKAYTYYKLHPITFTRLDHPTYDDMRMAKRTKPSHETQKVSVILPAFKAETGIAIAIESILEQTWSNLELLIVDDCSPDQTYAVMKRYAAQDERIKIFQTPRNSGPYVARNIALQAASGEFITVNDADDWSHERKIELQVTHLINHPNIIANTSEHARLTEDLTLYRRGTPGKYIFPNMSSTMFRRKPVMEKLGYWDSVRFAADGEFKRRLLKAFGKESFVDLPTGPLSLPRQAVASLTSSSAFGYNGFFMGVRKEYVEGLEYYQAHASTLYYEFPLVERPFPVPEPMWPVREEKENGERRFDLVIAADFRDEQLVIPALYRIRQLHPDARIGLVQMYQFNLGSPLDLAPAVRDMIDGEAIQMLVYGEKVNTEMTYIIGYNIICVEQTYIPTIETNKVNIIIQDTEIETEKVSETIQELLNQPACFIPVNSDVRQTLEQQIQGETCITLAEEDWVLGNEQ